jgi:hypothetical protein
MLIKSFNSVQELDDNELRDCGILKYKRDICVLVNPNEYNNRTTRYGKAVIINESVSKGSKEGNMARIAVDNSVIIRVSVYFCSVIFEVPNNFQRSQVTVENAFTNEYQSLFDNNTTAVYMSGNFSSALNELEYSNPDLFYDIINNTDTVVFPPIYYSETHQYKRTDDIFCMGGYNAEIYGGSDLIDNKTKISFIDINLWDSIRLKVIGAMKNAEMNADGTLNIASFLYHDFSKFIGEGASFIYDSDAYAFNKPGSNIIGGDIPLKNYHTPSFLHNNVETALTLFEQTCHDIERDYGHVRVMCYPSKIGNKIKIKFKDYNTFPNNAIPLGETNEEGGSSSVDFGYEVEKEMVEAIEANKY